MPKGLAAFKRAARRIGDDLDRFIGEIPALDAGVEAPQLAAGPSPFIAATSPATAPAPAPADATNGSAPAPVHTPTPLTPSATAGSTLSTPVPAAASGPSLVAANALAAAKRTVNSAGTNGNGYRPATDGGTTVANGSSNQASGAAISAHPAAAKSTTLAAWSRKTR